MDNANDWTERTRGGTSFTGSDVGISRAHVVASALDMHLRGFRASRNATPKNMMKIAAEITGQRFRPRDYAGASAALKAWANARKGEPRQDTAPVSAPRPAPAHTCHYPGSDPTLCRGCKG